jgi:hypothetical protein
MTMTRVDDVEVEEKQDEEVEEEQGKLRAEMLQCADVKLLDAGNMSLSRHSRVEACYTSIYIRLLVLARSAVTVAPEEHSPERVIETGAALAGLDDESLEEVMDLHLAVAHLRYRIGSHKVNMLHILALARHIAGLVKS